MQTHVGDLPLPRSRRALRSGWAPRGLALRWQGRTWYLQLGDSGSARVVTKAFPFCSGTQEERWLHVCTPFVCYTSALSSLLNTPGSSGSSRPVPGPFPLPGTPFPSFFLLQLPAQARGCLPGENPPGLLPQQPWPHSNAIVALWPPTKSKFLKSRF